MTKQTKHIRLDTIDKVKAFMSKATAYPGDITIRNRRFAVDGKSIMGIFSLNLSSDLILETECNVPLTFADDFEV